MTIETKPQKAAWEIEREEKEALFNQVANPSDWRAPIEATIQDSDFDAVNDAVAYFTGTELERVSSVFDGGRVKVKAVGYRNGPCGP